MIASVHIEKTGGSSLAELIVRNYNGSSMLVYPCSVCGNFYTSSFFNEQFYLERGDCSTHKSASKFIASAYGEDIAIVHGHIPAGYFKQVEDNYDIKYMTWIRNPIIRYFSKFYDLLRDNQDITFEKYISNPSFSNMITGVFSLISIKRLSFVGIMERFSEEISDCGLFIDQNLKHIKNYHNGEYTNEITERVILNNIDDIQLYNTFCQMKGYKELVIDLPKLLN